MDAQIDAKAFDEALVFSRKKYTYSVERDLVESLIWKIVDKRKRMIFTEAMRFSLNELNIYSRNHNSRREAYRSAAAKYFSIKADLAREARSGTKPVKAKRKESVEGETVLEPNGQYAFRI